VRRAARGPAARVPATSRARGAVPGSRRRGRVDRARAVDPGPGRGLSSAGRPAPPEARGDTRPGRHRGERPPRGELGRRRGNHHGDLRRGARVPARHREVHARRPPRRHGRRTT
jgi:hypothetical protein